MGLFLLERRLRDYGDGEAFWIDGRSVSYRQFIGLVQAFAAQLEQAGVPEFAPTLLVGDIDPESVALLWACIARRLICIPHLAVHRSALDGKLRIAKPEWLLSAGIDARGEPLLSVEARPADGARPALYDAIASRMAPGLVLFTSGTTGEPKAAVHDFSLLLEKFHAKGKALRTLGFLLFDHWGGLNTIFHSLANGGCIVCVRNRAPAEICRTVAAARAELMPVSPSFLNLLLASGAQKSFDLSSLRLMTYGAEPMAPETLQAVRRAFPNIRLKQTYGLIELGVFPTQSRDQGSLFFKIDRRRADYRIVDGILQIKTKSAMLGYLNATSPFTDDGWYITGDEVETDGDFIRVLGRRSDIINVGGEKVYPAEVENVLLGIKGVIDARVYGEENFLLGKIVCAELFCTDGIDTKPFETKIKKVCADKLERFKVPVRVQFSATPLLGDRLKKAGATARSQGLS